MVRLHPGAQIAKKNRLGGKIGLVANDPKLRQQARRHLRLFLSDTPEVNRLLREEELDDDHLDLAIDMAVDEYNVTTPTLTPVTLDNYPSIWLLLHGASINTLKMAGIIQSRNELNYSSGGVTVRTFDKTQLYQSWIGMFVQEYERKKANFKIAANVNGALMNNISGTSGGLHSEYNTISWYW